MRVVLMIVLLPLSAASEVRQCSSSPAPPACCPLRHALQVMQKMERWIQEHRKDPRTSRLRRMVPTIGSFFVPLK